MSLSAKAAGKCVHWLFFTLHSCKARVRRPISHGEPLKKSTLWLLGIYYGFGLGPPNFIQL